MNSYLVTLASKRRVIVKADSYLEIDDRFYFYKSSDLMPVRSLEAAMVHEITIIPEYELEVLFHQHT